MVLYIDHHADLISNSKVFPTFLLHPVKLCITMSDEGQKINLEPDFHKQTSLNDWDHRRHWKKFVTVNDSTLYYVRSENYDCTIYFGARLYYKESDKGHGPSTRIT